MNPDLVGKWSHSPAKALPILPQAQTNTTLILNPSSNPLYSSSLNFPNIFTCAKRSQTNCCALPAANSAEPHLIPQPPVVAKSCSNPRAHKAKVHYQRGTLVESRPCWQVVPLPSPAFLPTSSDEHHPDPESLCQSSLFPFPRFSQHSLSPCTPALPLYTPWQIMPRSL